MSISSVRSIRDRVITEPLISDIFVTIGNAGFKSHFTAHTNDCVRKCDLRNRGSIHIHGEGFAFYAATIIICNSSRERISTVSKIRRLCSGETCQSFSGAESSTILRPCNVGIGIRVFGTYRRRQHNLNICCIVIASICRTSNGNRIGRNDIDCIIDCSVTTCTFLCEMDTVDECLNIRTRSFGSVTEDGLVGLVVGKDFTVTSPNVGTVTCRRNISLEFIFVTTTDCIFGRSLGDGDSRHTYHFHRITARSGTIRILLTDTDKIFIFRCRRSNCQRIVVFAVENRSVARDLIPLISNVIRSKVADVGSESNIATSANAVLIMSDLYIDGIVHIDIERIRFNRAVSTIFNFHSIDIRIGTAVGSIFKCLAITTGLCFIIFIPSIVNRSITVLNISRQLNGIVVANQRRTDDMDFRSGLDVKSIIFDNRLATTAGLRSLHTINNLGDVVAVVHRIIREDSIRDTIQNLTISIPSVDVVFIVDTRGRGDTNRNGLTIADGIVCLDFHYDIRNCGNLDFYCVAAFTSCFIGVVTNDRSHHFVSVGSIKRVMESRRSGTCNSCTIHIPFVRNIAGVVGNSSFKVHRTVHTNGGVAGKDLNHRCTIYIYGEVDAFGFATVTAVNLHCIKIGTFRSDCRFGKGVGSACLDHITIEIPCIGRRSEGGGKGSSIRCYFALQRNFIFIGVAEI